MSLRIFALSFIFLTLATGCASSKIKERKDQRDKVVQAAKLYCEFVNGDIYPDIDVALNLQMGKYCDSEKPFSLTNYKTPAENPGVLFCCSTATPKGAAPAAVFDKAPKKTEKSEKKADSTENLGD
jgi:hypothetical protein